MSDESLQKRMMKEGFNEKRNRGRSHKRWLDLIKEDTGLPVATTEKYVKNKNRWRTNVNIKWAKPYQGGAITSSQGSQVLFYIYGFLRIHRQSAFQICQQLLLKLSKVRGKKNKET